MDVKTLEAERANLEQEVKRLADLVQNSTVDIHRANGAIAQLNRLIALVKGQQAPPQVGVPAEDVALAETAAAMSKTANKSSTKKEGTK